MNNYVLESWFDLPDVDEFNFQERYIQCSIKLCCKTKVMYMQIVGDTKESAWNVFSKLTNVMYIIYGYFFIYQ